MAVLVSLNVLLIAEGYEDCLLEVEMKIGECGILIEYLERFLRIFKLPEDESRVINNGPTDDYFSFQFLRERSQ